MYSKWKIMNRKKKTRETYPFIGPYIIGFENYLVSVLYFLYCFFFIFFIYPIPTCIMVMCSRIHWWREEASSLNWSNFFWASASKRGWPGGGSGKTSYNWDTYVMIDFSSGSGVSTSENTLRYTLNFRNACLILNNSKFSHSREDYTENLDKDFSASPKATT